MVQAPLFCLLAITLLIAPTASAQIPDSAKARQDTIIEAVNDTLAQRAQREVIRESDQIGVIEVAAVLGGVVALSVLDEPVQRWAQRNRTRTTDDISSVFRKEGEPIFYAGVSLTTLAAGVVLQDADVRRAGGRMVAAVLLAGLTSEGIKRLVGRSRPNERAGAFSFHPFTSLDDSAGFSTRSSFPSGHTTAAFAIATSLSDDINEPLVSVGLYAFALGTAYSRINDNRHWLSDTALGAVLGIASAKFVNGHWQFFGIEPPGFLITPTGTPTLGYTLDF
ncbi:MAG: phosphatase PAP2 family protein [Gemmatimonadales bacterium]